MKKGCYEVVLRKRRGRYIPKKVLRHKKFEVNPNYTFTASVWIADTPNSNLVPTVNLTIQHNGDYVRMCFKSAVWLVEALRELRTWTLDMFELLDDRHRIALEEFLAAHEGRQPEPRNDHTVYTVIQDFGERKLPKRSGKVDSRTGEVLDEQETAATSGQ